MWLSELEIIRAKSIYARLSTEGTYENDPVGSGPLTDLAPGLVDDDIGDAEKNDEADKEIWSLSFRCTWDR